MFIAIPKEAMAFYPLPHGLWNCRIYLGQSKGQTRRALLQGNEDLDAYKIFKAEEA